MSTPLERAEEGLSWVGLAVAETLRAVELAAIAVLALPVYLVRHAHRHRAHHAHERIQRLARAGSARLRRLVARAQRKLHVAD